MNLPPASRATLVGRRARPPSGTTAKTAPATANDHHNTTIHHPRPTHSPPAAQTERLYSRVRLFCFPPQKPVMADQITMLDAAKEGRLEKVQRLVRGGTVDARAGDERDAWNRSALLLAASYGHLEMVRWLVREGGSSVEEKSNKGSTALLCAALNGHFAVMRWLVREGGSSVEEKSNDGWTALLFAALNGHLEMVRWLVREGGSSVEEKSNHGGTALLCAADNGHLEVVRWLVREGGSSVEERDNYGWTALLRASEKGHVVVMRWLLSEGGSSIDEQDNNGRSLWEKVPKWMEKEENKEDEDNEDVDDAVDEEAATACLRTCLTLGAPPDGFDAETLLSPTQQELVRKSVIVRTRLPAWLERRRSLVRAGLSRCLPSALGDVVQGYCEPSEEEVWDEVAGVPLGDVWGQLVDLGTECSRLWDANARLREGVERNSGEISLLRGEIAQMRELIERLQEGREGRKRARGGKQEEGRGDAKRGRGSGGLL